MIACSDLDACTTADHCEQGVCVGSAPLSCDDGSACTADACDPTTGCTNTIISCDDGNECTDDSCDPQAGCVNAANAASCDDEDLCTGSGSCQGGVCQPGPENCTAGEIIDDCSVLSGECDATDGSCLTLAVNEGASCADGDRCTSDDFCQDGVCVPGAPISVDEVYFTTDSGVYRWTSDTQVLTQLSSFGSYAIALSPSGEVFVGTGGREALGTLSGAGIYWIDALGAAQPFSTLAAEDLQFDGAGVLHASNDTGIYSLATNGAATQRSTNPTTQFAFDSANTVVTTNGSAYAAVFGRSTDRIDLSTDVTTLLNGDGGEDIQVLDSGRTLLCGQGGIFELTNTNTLVALSPVAGMAVFNFRLSESDNLYVGNADTYGSSNWVQGLYARAYGEVALTQHGTQDINALVIDTICP